MKKAISILAAAMMLSCTFVSCGSSKDDDKQEGLVGKWAATEETMKKTSESDEMNYIAYTVEFMADNKMLLRAEADVSEDLTFGDSTVNWWGKSVPYTYDGTTIDVNGQMKFVRTGSADESSIYGEYKSDTFAEAMGLGDGCELVFDFESADKTTFIVSAEGTYEYNEETKTLTTTLDDEDGPSTVELDGDTLKLTDKEGTDVYTRVK